MNTPPWWRDAVIYQIYVRSFADGNGDGVGDLPGITSRLEAVRDLGVDAIWVTPFYASPLRDGGYDIADYTAVLPEFGTLPDFQELVSQAHARGIRVVTDLVMNHTSDQHPWFQASRADPEGPYGDFYVWRDDSAGYPDARRPTTGFSSAALAAGMPTPARPRASAAVSPSGRCRASWSSRHRRTPPHGRPS